MRRMVSAGSDSALDLEAITRRNELARYFDPHGPNEVPAGPSVSESDDSYDSGLLALSHSADVAQRTIKLLQPRGAGGARGSAGSLSNGPTPGAGGGDVPQARKAQTMDTVVREVKYRQQIFRMHKQELMRALRITGFEDLLERLDSTFETFRPGGPARDPHGRPPLRHRSPSFFERLTNPHKNPNERVIVGEVQDDDHVKHIVRKLRDESASLFGGVLPDAYGMCDDCRQRKPLFRGLMDGNLGATKQICNEFGCPSSRTNFGDAWRLVQRRFRVNISFEAFVKMYEFAREAVAHELDGGSVVLEPLVDQYRVHRARAESEAVSEPDLFEQDLADDDRYGSDSEAEGKADMSEDGDEDDELILTTSGRRKRDGNRAQSTSPPARRRRARRRRRTRLPRVATLGKGISKSLHKSKSGTLKKRSAHSRNSSRGGSKKPTSRGRPRRRKEKPKRKRKPKRYSEDFDEDDSDVEDVEDDFRADDDERYEEAEEDDGEFARLTDELQAVRDGEASVLLSMSSHRRRMSGEMSSVELGLLGQHVHRSSAHESPMVSRMHTAEGPSLSLAGSDHPGGSELLPASFTPEERQHLMDEPMHADDAAFRFLWLALEVSWLPPYDTNLVTGADILEFHTMSFVNVEADVIAHLMLMSFVRQKQQDDKFTYVSSDDESDNDTTDFFVRQTDGHIGTRSVRALSDMHRHSLNNLHLTPAVQGGCCSSLRSWCRDLTRRPAYRNRLDSDSSSLSETHATIHDDPTVPRISDEVALSSRRVFSNFDSNSNGVLNRSEFKQLLTSLHPQHNLLTDAALDYLMNVMTRRDRDEIALPYRPFQFLYAAVSGMKVRMVGSAPRALVDGSLDALASVEDVSLGDRVQVHLAGILYWLTFPLAFLLCAGLDEDHPLHWRTVFEYPLRWIEQEPSGGGGRSKLAAGLVWLIGTFVYVNVLSALFVLELVDDDGDVELLERLAPAALYAFWIIMHISGTYSQQQSSAWRVLLRFARLRTIPEAHVRPYHRFRTKRVRGDTLMKRLLLDKDGNNIADLTRKSSYEVMFVLLFSLGAGVVPTAVRWVADDPVWDASTAELVVSLNFFFVAFVFAYLVSFILLSMYEALVIYRALLKRLTALTQRREGVDQFFGHVERRKPRGKRDKASRRRQAQGPDDDVARQFRAEQQQLLIDEERQSRARIPRKSRFRGYYMPLTSTANVDMWAHLRAYVQSNWSGRVHEYEGFLGWVLMALLVLATYYVYVGLIDGRYVLTPVLLTMTYNLLVLGAWAVVIVWNGYKTNQVLHGHIDLLNKAQYKMLVRHKDTSRTVGRDESAKATRLLQSLLQLIKDSDEDLKVFGFTLSSEFLQASVAVVVVVAVTLAQGIVLDA